MTQSARAPKSKRTQAGTDLRFLHRPRWGSNAPLDRTEARNRLLDAADACFARYGVLKTTMADVAAQAGVSRATLYRFFTDRDQLVLGVLLREAEAFLRRLETRFEEQQSFADTLVEAVVLTVEAVHEDERLALLFAPDTAGQTGSIAGASEALFELAGRALRPQLEAARAAGQLREGIDLDDASEWILRTILSLLTVRGPRPRAEAELRDFVRNFLVPALTALPSAPSRRSAPTRGA